MKNHFKILDILRGCAALAVFIHHFYQQFYKSNSPSAFFDYLGVWGVTVFFVLSGFCIHWSRLNAEKNNTIDVKGYLLRRFFRIYPAFIFAIAICFFVGRHYTSNLLPVSSLKDVFYHITLLSSFMPEHRVAVNNVLWTVVIECHFYLLYAFLMKYFSSLKNVIIMCLISIVVSAVTFVSSILFFDAGIYRVTFQHLAFASWFVWCLGALVAQLRFEEIDIVQKKYINILAIGMFSVSLLIPIIFKFGIALQLQRFVLPFLIAAFLFFVLYKNYSFTRLASPFLWLGFISYSLYLLHPIAILLTQNFTYHGIVLFVMTLAIAIILATVSYLLIEKNFIKIGKRYQS